MARAVCDNLRGDGQDVALYDQLRQDYPLRGNINLNALDINSDAVATAVLSLAYDTSTVNGVQGKPGRHLGVLKSEGPNPVDAMAGRNSS